MPDVSLGRFSRWIEKFSNAKGGPVLVDIAPSIQSIISLDKGVDHRYLEGWNRFGAQQTNPAVAGQNGLFKMRNPPGSNVIFVLESLIMITGAAAVDSGQLSWGASTSDLTSLTTLTFTRIDPRGNPQPTAILSFQTSAAIPPPLQQIQLANNGIAQFVTSLNTEYVVLPGQAIQLTGSTVNTAVTASWLWRERALESSELT